MSKIVFAYTKPSSRSEYLINLLKDDFDLTVAASCEEITDILHNSYDSIEALIIDHPADKEDIGRLFAFVEKNNSFMFTLPILILTDPQSMQDDAEFMSDLVMGMIYEGENKKVVLQRIKNTIRFCNSASFDEFSHMLESLPSSIYVKDGNGKYVFCSKPWHHNRKPEDPIRGLTDFDIRKDKGNAQIAFESDQRVIKSGEGATYIIKEDDDEGVEYLQIIKEPLKDEDGKVKGIIAIINNVTDSEILRQELRLKSITDQLTGLYNRFYFEEITKKKRVQENLPLTFISADCDGLKNINDKFGHVAGDRYICLARDLIKAHLPAMSYFFRMGGDEFLAVIPRLSRAEADRLVKEIAEDAQNYKTDRFELKLSVGCYTLTDSNTTVETAVNLSDKAMYEMKKGNR